jgi:hypothetical protein
MRALGGRGGGVDLDYMTGAVRVYTCPTATRRTRARTHPTHTVHENASLDRSGLYHVQWDSPILVRVDVVDGDVLSERWVNGNHPR